MILLGDEEMQRALVGGREGAALKKIVRRIQKYGQILYEIRCRLNGSIVRKTGGEAKRTLYIEYGIRCRLNGSIVRKTGGEAK
jgi:hypothetical protein